MELMDHRSVLSPERKCLDRIYVDCFSDALFAIWTEIPFSSHTVLLIPAFSLQRSGIAISSLAELYRQSRWPQVGLFRVADDYRFPSLLTIVMAINDSPASVAAVDEGKQAWSRFIDVAQKITKAQAELLHAES
jgi:hypothetical protein